MDKIGLLINATKYAAKIITKNKELIMIAGSNPTKSDVTIETAYLILGPILGAFTIKNLKDLKLLSNSLGDDGYVLMTLEKNLSFNDELKNSAAAIKTKVLNDNGIVKIIGTNIISVVQTVTAAKSRV
ncbi:MAG: hypothetical protein WC621_02340 [Patescibacteria group bacterium]